MKDIKSGIYRIINVRNGHCYIGSAVNLGRRGRAHFSKLRKGEHQTKYLQHAFNLYGEQSFLFDILEYCEIEELITREQFWIDSYRSKGEILYNMRFVADSNLGLKFNMTAEHKRKISIAGKGRIVSDETKKRLSIANSGKTFSDETKNKISTAKKGLGLGRITSDETKKKLSMALKGRVFSDETRERMSVVHRGKTLSEETKKKMFITRKKNLARILN